jgi:hypothetical protein
MQPSGFYSGAQKLLKLTNLCIALLETETKLASYEKSGYVRSRFYSGSLLIQFGLFIAPRPAISVGALR